MSDNTNILKLIRRDDSSALRRFHTTAVRAAEELDDALRTLPARQQTAGIIDAIVAVDEALSRLRAAIISAGVETGELEWR